MRRASIPYCSTDETNYWDASMTSLPALQKSCRDYVMPVYDGATRIFGDAPDGIVDPTPTSPKPTSTVEPTPTGNVLKGDINLDGVVDSTDLTLMKRFVLRKWPNRDIVYPEPYGKLTPEEFNNGDVNSDNAIDSTDVTLLKRFILRKIIVFPNS